MVPLGLLLLLLPPFESKYTSQSMAGTHGGRRGCSRRAFHLRPSRDHALPPKRVSAFKSPVGDAFPLSLSLSPRIFPHCSSVQYRLISPPLFYYPARSSTGNVVHNATYIAPISILISYSFSFQSFENEKKIREIRSVVVREIISLIVDHFHSIIVTVESAQQSLFA